jgi:hypothetical protein
LYLGKRKEQLTNRSKPNETKKEKHTTTLIFATELVFSLSTAKLFRRMLSGKPGALPVCLLLEM